MSLQSVFAPSAQPLTRGVRGGVSASLQIKTTVVVFTGNITADDRVRLAFLMAILGTSSTGTSEQWKSYIVSYTCLIFQGMITHLTRESFTVIEINVETIRDQIQKVFDLQLVAQAEEALNGEPEDKLHGVTLNRNLPTSDLEEGAKWMGAECTPKHVYCHYALIVFLIMKQISSSGTEALSIARPKALISKYSLDETTEILNGRAKLSELAMYGINIAWNELSSFRSACMLQFIKFGASDTDLGQDIIYTNIRLMRFGQMTHALLIYQFIRSYPWVDQVPSLRGSVEAYRDSVKAANDIDVEVRPFIKLVWGDKANIFPRKEMEALVACAVSVLQEDQETLADFYRSAQYGSVIEAFHEERALREGAVKPTQLAVPSDVAEEDEVEEALPE